MDSFQVLGEVGSGTFGTVYQANVLHESMGRFRLLTQVALKKISLSCGRAIEKEMMVLHDVKGHANVIELLACFIQRMKLRAYQASAYLGFPFFVNATPYKEYVGNITELEYTSYMHQLLLAVELIHWREIIHR